jgi:cytochrome P450
MAYGTFLYNYHRSHADRKHRDTNNDGIVGIRMGGYKFNIVMAPSMAKALFSRPHEVDVRSHVESFMTRIFDFQKTFSEENKHALFKDIDSTLVSMSRGSFLSEGSAFIAQGIERTMSGLVSLNGDIASQDILSNAKILSGKRATVEADLFPLIRHYVVNTTTRILMGNNFADNYPDLLQDYIRFDSDANLLYMGLPKWLPFSRHRRAVAVRQRLNDAIAELHAALQAEAAGNDPGPRWSNLSDVPQVLKARAEIWKNAGLNPGESAPRDLALLWGSTANTNPALFWTIYHVLKTPGLISQIREEIAPFAKIVPEQSSGEGSRALPQLSIDLKSIMNCCPLLKATFYETLRLESPIMVFKRAITNLTLTESPQDSISLQGEGSVQRSYSVQKGEFILVPYFSIHKNKRYFSEPERFNPARFIVPGKLTVDLGMVTPFGGGSTKCKGKSLAEIEVLMYLAGILTMWDLELVENQGYPEHESGVSAFRPKKNLRVRFSHRSC